MVESAGIEPASWSDQNMSSTCVVSFTVGDNRVLSFLSGAVCLSTPSGGLCLLSTSVCPYSLIRGVLSFQGLFLGSHC